MTRILTIIFLCIGIHSSAQILRVDTLKLKGNPLFVSESSQLNYPLIRTGNTHIDSLINLDIKNKFTYNENISEPLDSALIKWAADVIAFLDFQVTYNKNNIISLHISAEGCGANCSGWTEYFNYSTLTGKAIAINSAVAINGKFGEILVKDKTRQYENQRNELKVLLLDEESGLDSLTYELALENYYDCESSFRLDQYALYPEYLVIIEECYFPNFIKNLTPVIELKYSYNDIKEFLLLNNFP